MRAEVAGGAVLTPPAGSPGAVRSVADGLTAWASRAEALAQEVRRGREVAGESWAGAAADAFASYGVELEDLTGEAAEPLRAIGRALGRYADALEVAQRSVEAASLVVPVTEGRREAGLAWQAYRSECAAVAAELAAIAGGVAALAGRSRVVEVVSARSASGSRGGSTPHLSEEQWQGVQLALLDLQGLRGNVLGWVGFMQYYERGAGSLVAQGRAWAASDDIWRMAQEAVEGGNWGRLVSGGLAVEEMSPVVARLSQGAGLVGKALGPLGLGLGVRSSATELRDGNVDRGSYQAVATVLGGVATFAPPPVGLACGSAALAMAAGELLYDNVPAVQDFVDAGVDSVADVTEGLAGVASGAGHAVLDLLT